MGRKANLDIREEEILAECVRQYPCLYDKTNKSYNDKNYKQNSWKKVDEELGNEEGESKFAFINLKKRWGKKKNKLKKATKSGAGTNDIARYQKQLEPYEFLGWLDQFISLRSDTQTNIPTVGDGKISDGERFKEEEEDDYNTDCESVVVTSKRKLSSNLCDSETPNEAQATSKAVTKKSESRYYQVSKKAKKSEIEQDNNKEILHAISTRLMEKSRSEQRDEEEIFGRMVANELRSLPKRLQIELKHGISNLIYSCQMTNLQNETPNRQNVGDTASSQRRI